MHTTRIRGLIDWMKSLSIEDRCYNPYLIKLKTIKKGLKLPKCQSNWYLLLFRSSRTSVSVNVEYTFSLRYYMVGNVNNQAEGDQD
jgi:hypothetical protein